MNKKRLPVASAPIEAKRVTRAVISAETLFVFLSLNIYKSIVQVICCEDERRIIR